MAAVLRLGLLVGVRLSQQQLSCSVFLLVVLQYIHGPVPSCHRTIENTCKDRSRTDYRRVDHAWQALRDLLVPSRSYPVPANLTFVLDMVL